jgi:hypothetical protein
MGISRPGAANTDLFRKKQEEEWLINQIRLVRVSVRSRAWMRAKFGICLLFEEFSPLLSGRVYTAMRFSCQTCSALQRAGAVNLGDCGSVDGVSLSSRPVGSIHTRRVHNLPAGKCTPESVQFRPTVAKSVS